jgi:hypothetical protein
MSKLQDKKSIPNPSKEKYQVTFKRNCHWTNSSFISRNLTVKEGIE